MPQLKLRTLGGVSLDGPPGQGAIVLDEPRLVALVVLLAIAGDAGVSDDELLLRLTPDATAEKGRVEVARLIAVVRLRLGGESAIIRTSNGYALAPGLVALDVRVLPEPAPTECAAFLAGFKLPGSPEFREWVADTRRRVEPSPVAAEQPLEKANGSRLRHRLTRPATLVGMFAVVIAGGAYFVAPRSASGFAAGDPLLVSDIKNETGDSVFDGGLMTAATVALQQSSRLQLYSRSRLPGVYRLMQITNRDTALTFELAKEVAQRDGVRFVLGLQLARMGDGYRVIGRLVDVSTPDRVFETSTTARSKKEVLNALDDVLVAMRAKLGEPRRDIEDRRVPLPFVTTSSLEALRSYGDGGVAWNHGNYTLARELWTRAVDLDSGFAMAYGSLGSSHYFNHNRELGERYFTEAFKRSNRLTEFERLRLKETWFGYRGQSDSSLAYAAQITKRYPSVISWYNYGTDLMKAHRDSEAIAALKTALTFDPKHVASYINLATTIKRADDLESSLAYYKRAAEIDSTVLYRGNLNHEYGSTLVRVGRYAEAESAFTRMSRSESVEARAMGFRSLGYLALWRGQADEAVTHYQSAAAAMAQNRSPLGEGRNRLLLSTAYRTAGRDREADAEVTKTMSMVTSPYFEPTFLAMLATNAIKLGRVGDAQTILKVLRGKLKRENPVDVASDAYVSGLIALATHHADSALAYARAARALPMSIQRMSLEAEAWRALGQMDSARAVVERFRQDPGFGYEGQDDWLHAPLVLGDLMLAQRDTAGAVREYQRLLDQWRGASPALADVAAARARISSLRATEKR